MAVKVDDIFHWLRPLEVANSYRWFSEMLPLTTHNNSDNKWFFGNSQILRWVVQWIWFCRVCVFGMLNGMKKKWLAYHTVDGRNLKQPPGMVLEPVNSGINYLSLNWFSPRISGIHPTVLLQEKVKLAKEKAREKLLGGWLCSYCSVATISKKKMEETIQTEVPESGLQDDGFNLKIYSPLLP